MYSELSDYDMRSEEENEAQDGGNRNDWQECPARAKEDKDQRSRDVLRVVRERSLEEREKQSRPNSALSI